MTQQHRSTFAPAAERDFDAFLHPADRYDRPSDVLADAALTNEQRRAVLSAWASDACAVPSRPALRRPAFATRPVTVDEIMDALRTLDGIAPPEAAVRERA